MNNTGSELPTFSHVRNMTNSEPRSLFALSQKLRPRDGSKLAPPPRGLCREPSSHPQDGCLRSRTGGFVDTRPRAVVGKQDGLMPVLGRAA